ncbi:MAG: class I SAM-dependent methyltransferase [bacterium]|nr:class I SAM-dependent methyltransferase [bacterium]
MTSKQAVKAFWERDACGEHLYLPDASRESYLHHARVRYQLEPFLSDFARFDRYRGKSVLEVGVGLGADHQRFAEAGAILAGTDITRRAVTHTRRRFELLGLRSNLLSSDAENLPFRDQSFDLVYSWGVIHHTPDTAGAVAEIRRVLRPGGECKVMIYQKYSIVGFMLWARYALLTGRWRTSLSDIYGRYLESPGTKAYSRAEALRLFRDRGFEDVEIEVHLTHGDLLSSGAGRRHRGRLLSLARRVWPRWLIRRALARYGLFMTIRARPGPGPGRPPPNPHSPRRRPAAA